MYSQSASWCCVVNVAKFIHQGSKRGKVNPHKKEQETEVGVQLASVFLDPFVIVLFD